MKESIHNKRESGVKLFTLIVVSIFYFSYLLFFQCDLIREIYVTLPVANMFEFNPYVVSLIITLILLLFVPLSKRVFRFTSLYYPCNYIVSSILLGILTSGNGIHIFNHSIIYWVVLATLLILTLSICKILSLIPRGRNDTTYAPTTVLFLIVNMLATLSAGNTDENLHRQLRVASLVEKGEFEQALMVGREAEETNLLLTLYRADAMLQLPSSVPGGEIGNKLFSYPLPEDNMPSLIDSLTNRVVRESTYSYELNVELTISLLQNNLERFDSLMLYNGNGYRASHIWYPDMMPRHYLEAVVLLHHIGKSELYIELEELYPQQIKVVEDKFTQFLSITQQYASDNREVLLNRLYMRYKDSYWYWWYKSQI